MSRFSVLQYSLEQDGLTDQEIEDRIDDLADRMRKIRIDDEIVAEWEAQDKFLMAAHKRRGFESGRTALGAYNQAGGDPRRLPSQVIDSTLAMSIAVSWAISNGGLR